MKKMKKIGKIRRRRSRTRGGKRECVCMYVCMYVCMHIRIYVYLHVCMYVCMYVSLYVCVYVCMYACMCVCLYVSMYVYRLCRYPLMGVACIAQPYIFITLTNIHNITQ